MHEIHKSGGNAPVGTDGVMPLHRRLLLPNVEINVCLMGPSRVPEHRVKVNPVSVHVCVYVSVCVYICLCVYIWACKLSLLSPVRN